jgi:hypothetical protein
MSESERNDIIRVLLNATKAIVGSGTKSLKEYSLDHDTKNFNIKIEITQR